MVSGFRCQRGKVEVEKLGGGEVGRVRGQEGKKISGWKAGRPEGGKWFQILLCHLFSFPASQLPGFPAF